MGRFFLFILFLVASIQVSAQKVQVSGYFTKDSARLGERVGYVLKASYPQAAQLIFPDSAFDFSPFVFLEKKTFVSATTEGITQDSAVYFLSNFSLEPSSYLALPVYELNRYDSITHYTTDAELKLKLNLDSIPEQLQFKENNIYQPLDKPFNWFVFSAIIGLFSLSAFSSLFLPNGSSDFSEKIENDFAGFNLNENGKSCPIYSSKNQINLRLMKLLDYGKDTWSICEPNLSKNGLLAKLLLHWTTKKYLRPCEPSI